MFFLQNNKRAQLKYVHVNNSLYLLFFMESFYLFILVTQRTTISMINKKNILMHFMT